MDINTILVNFGTIADALNNPVVGMIGGTLVGFGFSLLIKANPGAGVALDHLADYNAALIEAVEGAETTGFPGARKLNVALNHMDKFLADNGVKGNARDVTMERIRTDIELARAIIFPTKAA